MRYFGIIWAAKSKPIWPWSKLENFLIYFFYFASNLIFENFAVQWAHTETVFCCEISATKIYVHFGPIRWVLCRFSIFWFFVFEIAIKLGFFWLCTNILACTDWVSTERSYRWLRQRRNDFIVDWVNAEPIFCFCSASVQYLSQRENGIFSIHSKEGLGFATDTSYKIHPFLDEEKNYGISYASLLHSAAVWHIV